MQQKKNKKNNVPIMQHVENRRTTFDMTDHSKRHTVS